MTAAPIRFRYHSAITVAGLVTAIGTVPLVNAKWFLAPVLLVPLAVALWAWRAGTDADLSGVRVRALLGHRHIPWQQIAELVPTGRGRVAAVLSDGQSVSLPAVTQADLPRLVAASGEELPEREKAQ